MVKKILKRKKLENNIYILGYSLDMADEDNSQRAMKDAFLKIFLSDKIMRTGMIQINMLEILKQVMESNFVGALIGGFCTLIGSIWVWKSQSKEQEKHAASMLYYDLCSIENYLRNERSSVNIRYSVEWQKMVSSCAFLPLDVMEKIYNIYDLVYDYNYHYKLKEDRKQVIYKEEIHQYIKLKKEFFEVQDNKVISENRNAEYEKIIDVLKKHMKM